MQKYQFKNLYLIALIFIINLNVALAQTAADIEKSIQYQGGLSKFLVSIANKASEDLPQRTSSESEVFNVVKVSNSLNFYVRYLNYEPNQLDLIQAEKSNRQIVVNGLCYAPVASYLIKRKAVDYIYLYYSKSRKYMFEIKVSRPDCD